MFGYNGIDGNLTQCGELESATCLTTMGDSEETYPYNILWVNDDHTLAVNYMCSEMMWGLFSFQWWNVMSKDQSVDGNKLAFATSRVLEANVGYTELSSRGTEQGSTCEYDWTMAE